LTWLRTKLPIVNPCVVFRPNQHAGRAMMRFEAWKPREVFFSLAACLVVLAAVTILTGTAQSQVLYGSLTGNITDPSGVAVQGATVEVLNLWMNVKRETIADERGVYLFTILPPGNYTITVTAPGFSQYVTENIPITPNTVQRNDIQLKIGQLSVTITVEAGTARLQADRSDMNTQLDSRVISDLPITGSAGRNVQALLKLVPGFSLITEGQSSDGGNPQRTMTANINGNSMQANQTRIDGASNSYIWLPFNSAYVPPAESIESVSIATNSFEAEQSGHGAVVSVTTKSGTNQYHGSAYEYHTDAGLKARNRFLPYGQAKPKYVFNQYGGSIGGPIKRNKLFFFTDWEGTKRRMTSSTTRTVVNPAGIFDAAGNANLSAAIPAGTDCNKNPVEGCIYNPDTGNADGTGRSAFAGNIIPAGRIDAAAKTLLGRIDKNGFINSDGVNANSNYMGGGVTEMNRDTLDARADYIPNGKTTVFGRYSISRALYYDPPLLGAAMGGATGGGQVGQAPSRVQNVGLGTTFMVNSQILLDINGAYTRQRLGAEHAPDLDLGNYGVNGLKIPGTNGTSRLYQGTPAFWLYPNGQSGGSTWWNGMGNVDTGNPFQFRDNQYVVNANLSWTIGVHNLRFGIEHTRSGMNHFQPQGGTFQTPRGSFRFSGSVTALYGGASANKTNSLAQFLLGLPDEVGRAQQYTTPNALRFRTWSFYARDRWQITRRLTMNTGLRWEYFPFATADHGGVRVFDPATGNVLIGGHGSIPVDNVVDVGAGQWLPRFGLAYRLTPKIVLRAGYGIGTDSNNYRYLRNNYPATTNSDVLGKTVYYPVASLTGETLAPYPNLPAGIPMADVVDISSGMVPLPDGVGFGGATVPLKFRRGYIHSYNLTLQGEAAGIVGEISYVGTRGIRMLTNENLNIAPIGGGQAGRLLNAKFGKNWNDINSMSPDTNSYYDGMQLRATRRFTGGSTVGVVYTFSKAINSIDNEEVSSWWTVTGGYLFWPYPDYRYRNKAIASYDRTHNLTIFGAYEFPFGKGRQWAKEGIAAMIAGGWHLNWTLVRASGIPYTLIGGGSQVAAPGNMQTADQIAPLRILGGVGPVPTVGKPTPICAKSNLSCHYFDPNSFQPVPGNEVRFGNTGRNMLRGPGFFNLDASVFRDFKITEQVKFQIRAECFGVTNTPHLGHPGTDPSNENTFGVITSTLNLAGRGQATGGERQWWFAGKVIF
jgi:hypothetical protein